MKKPLAAFAVAALPVALAVTPAARWGHQAVYVKSKQAMYVVGGQVSTSGTEITNEVLVLPLNASSPTFSLGPSTGLPPHAFAAMSVTSDSTDLVVVGGMTSSCASDAVTHSLSLDGDSWADANPTDLVRRRGADMVFIDDGSTNGKMMVVGGISDTYVCASSTSAFPAADVLSLPMNTTSLVSTRNLPTSLTGSELAVADFAMTTSSDGKIYLAGGQSSSGDLVTLDTLGVWNTTAGWTSQSTTGDVPAGRVGASLVAHPSLDLLILHGGSTTDGTTDTPSSLLAFLNTTTWTWSTPSNLQPPSSSAAAYHTSVITDSGVMITAFGLGSGSNPRSDVFYLDMRDPTQASWSWKSVWSSSMLEAYSSGSSTTGLAAAAASSTSTSTGLATDASDSSDDGMSAKETTSIVVPVVVGGVVLLSILMYLVRRRVRLSRKRRMARHFALEDDDDLAASRAPGGRKTKTQYSFGRDANEKDGNFFTDLGSHIKGIVSRYGAQTSEGPRDSFEGMREMAQVGRASNNRAIKWEEIDFGLGRLDENRREAEASSRDSSFSAPAGTPTHGAGSMAFPMPIASTHANPFEDADEDLPDPGPLIHVQHDSDSPRVGTPQHDGQMPLVPSLTVEPPTVPPTPAGNLGTAYPAMSPAPAVPASPVADESLDWNMLQQELEAKPAFRSISPTSTLRSFAHQAPVSSMAPMASSATANVSRRAVTPPHLPPLDFQRSPSPQSITLVSPKTGRRTAEVVPFSGSDAAPALSPSSRTVSNPLGGRHLAGTALVRHGSAPISPGSTSSSGNATPTSTARLYETHAHPSSVNYDVSARRASGPVTLPSPASPVAPGTRGGALRVVNVTEGEGEGEGLAL